jgi:hypothetical protein
MSPPQIFHAALGQSRFRGTRFPTVDDASAGGVLQTGGWLHQIFADALNVATVIAPDGGLLPGVVNANNINGAILGPGQIQPRPMLSLSTLTAQTIYSAAEQELIWNTVNFPAVGSIFTVVKPSPSTPNGQIQAGVACKARVSGFISFQGLTYTAGAFQAGDNIQVYLKQDSGAEWVLGQSFVDASGT